MNPLVEFDPFDRCWCDSGRLHKNCHQIRGLHPPGAPTPADTDELIYISPDTAVSRNAFTLPTASVPITQQYPTPQAVPVVIDDVVKALAHADQLTPPLGHREIGKLRYAVLDSNGLVDPVAVRSGAHDQQLARLIPDLAHGALDLARATIDQLLADQNLAEGPVVLHSDVSDVRRLVGQTLFWADHYVTTDRLAAVAIDVRSTDDDYKSAVADLLELRPLVEAGLVVPAFVDLALALVSDDVDHMTEVDLAHDTYVAWAERQVVVEGPTAREAAFAHVVDHYQTDAGVYFHSRLVRGTAEGQGSQQMQVQSHMFNAYDPQYNYGPWLATVRRQAVARLTRDLVGDLAVATALGADLITASPFRARALRRRRASLPEGTEYDLNGAVWADVPWLPEASSELLVKIAGNEPRVNELRRATAAALRTVARDDIAGNAQVIADVAGDLSASASRLGRDLRQQRSLDLVTAPGLAIGSVLVAGTFGPPLALGGLLAGAAASIPTVRARVARRRSAAYAFWMARPR